MAVIEVVTKTQTYAINIGVGYLTNNSQTLSNLFSGKKIAIITDENVAFQYLENLQLLFSGNALHTITLPAGEATKSLVNFEKIITQLIHANFKRTDVLVALGGGVIGDLTGFCAACYLRGISFIQIPTTLLAQVDASVGGKTAVNHHLGKNLIGTFYQPEAVFIDIDTLNTLPEREFNAGMAEVIKYALIMDRDFFTWLKKYKERIKCRNKETLLYLIEHCCRLKKRLVETDVFDKSARQLLNFGHTFAHAIETDSAYDYLHGEAVAIGMVIASYLSYQRGAISQNIFNEIKSLLAFFHLPIAWPKHLEIKNSLIIMQRDKKRTQAQLTFILLAQLGQAIICHDIDNNEAILAMESTIST